MNKFLEFLYESFDSSEKIIKVQEDKIDGNKLVFKYFNIEEKRFRIFIEISDSDASIGFEQFENNIWTTDTSGTSDFKVSSKVLGTVLKEALDLTNKKEITSVFFMTNEEKRANIYRRFIHKFDTKSGLKYQGNNSENGVSYFLFSGKKEQEINKALKNFKYLKGSK